MHINAKANSPIFLGVGGSSTQYPEEISVYPNPVKDFLTVKFPTKGTHTVTIYNIIGKQVATKTVQEENEVKLNIGDQPNGIYFVQFTLNGKNITKRCSKQ